jgi:flagellar protein FliS
LVKTLLGEIFMLMDSGYDSYQQVDLDAQAAAANPHQLVVMLIDGLLDELERVRGHMTAGRLAEKGVGINKCMNILIGLTSALDEENGGEVAQNLQQLYDFCQMELYTASVKNDTERLVNVERVMGNIREGWVNFGKQA